jgi:hypothetical protein
MVKEWLINKISVDEAERKHLVEDERLGPEPVPFGFQFGQTVAVATVLSSQLRPVSRQDVAHARERVA